MHSFSYSIKANDNRFWMRLSPVIGWTRTRPRPRPLPLPPRRGRGLCARARTSPSATMMRLAPPSLSRLAPSRRSPSRRCVPLPIIPRCIATPWPTSRTPTPEPSASSARRTRSTSRRTAFPTLPGASADPVTSAIHRQRLRTRAGGPKPSSNSPSSPPSGSGHFTDSDSVL